MGLKAFDCGSTDRTTAVFIGTFAHVVFLTPTRSKGICAFFSVFSPKNLTRGFDFVMLLFLNLPHLLTLFSKMSFAGRLKISEVAGQSLAAEDVNGSSDPYFILK